MLLHSSPVPNASAPALDVIVIGAGAAGLSAASSLRAGGIELYAVLEAKGTTGGRVQPFAFGDLTLENGANWVSGAGPPAGVWPHRAINPLFRLALALNLSMVRVPGSATNMSNWAVSSAQGKWTDRDRSRRKEANEVARCVSKMSHKAFDDTNMTAAAAAAACGWTLHDEVDNALLWQLFTGETGLPPQRMRADGYLPDPTYETFGPDDFFVKDQHPRGFARLLDAIAAGALDGGTPALDGGRLHLHTTVTRIEHTCDGVRVTAADGRTWHAKHAISTLPLGVLQRRADDLFLPRVPPTQLAALRSISMANCAPHAASIPARTRACCAAL